MSFASSAFRGKSISFFIFVVLAFLFSFFKSLFSFVNSFIFFSFFSFSFTKLLLIFFNSLFSSFNFFISFKLLLALISLFDSLAFGLFLNFVMLSLSSLLFLIKEAFSFCKSLKSLFILLNFLFILFICFLYLDNSSINLSFSSWTSLYLFWK